MQKHEQDWTSQGQPPSSSLDIQAHKCKVETQASILLVKHPHRSQSVLLPENFSAPYARFFLKKQGFFFIDIPRTSSTSIRAELGHRYGIAHRKSGRRGAEPLRLQLFPDHMPAKEVRQLSGPLSWEKLFTFTVVRNPWDRTLSFYRHVKRNHARRSQDFMSFVIMYWF